MRKSQSIFYVVVNALLFVAGVVALIAGAYSTWLLEAATATAFFAASLVLLFASTIDRFESLKGFGIEAKQRQLTRTLSEVNIVLEEVQRLNFFTAKSLAALYAKTGRVAGPPSAEEIYAVLTELRKSMTRAQASPEMIKEALSPCVRVMLHDLKYEICAPVLSALEIMAREKKSSHELRTARTAILDFNDFSETSFPGKIITALRSHPASDLPEAEEAARRLASFSADIQSLQRRGTIDEPSAWFGTVDK